MTKLSLWILDPQVKNIIFEFMELKFDEGTDHF